MTDDSSHPPRNPKNGSRKGEAHTELAFLNHEFLTSRPARTLRILAEYIEPEQRFKEYDVRDTIVFFGSARILLKAAAAESRAPTKCVMRHARRRARGGARHCRRHRHRTLGTSACLPTGRPPSAIPMTATPRPSPT